MASGTLEGLGTGTAAECKEGSKVIHVCYTAAYYDAIQSVQPL